jgi:hypothetical protein
MSDTLAAAPVHDPAAHKLDPRFSPDVVAAAQAADRKYTIFASVSLAQWAVESDYGRAMPPDSNNPFGIKAVGDQPYVASWTHETIGARYIKVVQRFARFASIAEAFEAHAKLLATSGYYVAARHALNPRQFANDLTGIYATGIPGHPYGEALIAIMDANDLYQFDAKRPGATVLQFPIGASKTGTPLWLQARLNAHGASPALVLDGIIGEATKAALGEFELAHSLPVTPQLSSAVLTALAA